MLHITSRPIDDHLTIVLEGRLDRNSADDLDKKLSGALHGINKITFDFNQLEYISSAGLRVILAAQKKLRGDDAVIITGASKEIRDVFDVTGFSKILKITWI